MKYEIVVVGAGIIGLATARAVLLRFPGKKLLVLEKENAAGVHQSGHNSGVIHSGIYYKPGSQKAKNCTRGYQLLVEYLKLENIPFEICGKLIVATTESERIQLAALKARGEQNGLRDLKLLDASEAKEREPNVNALEALWVPQAGIVNYLDVVMSLQKNIEELGGEIHFGTKVLSAKGAGQLQTSRGDFQYKKIINCAGLYSDQVGQILLRQHEKENKSQSLNHQIVPIRGEYYKLIKEKENLVRNLIYPVPDLRFPFLGVHFTRMIRGGVEAGPNAVLALSREGYSWGELNFGDIMNMISWPGLYKMCARYWDVGLSEIYRSLFKKKFVQSLQKLVPSITEDDLESGGSGVRAQALSRNGELIDDFLISKNGDAIQVYNAPSPAATSCLAIGESIANQFKLEG